MVVPNGWAEKSLLECCDLLQGLTYSPSNVQSYGLLVLRSSNIQKGKLVFDDCVYVNCKVDEIKYVKPNDILICVRNGSSTLIGKSCVINKSYNATFGAFMSVLRGDSTGYLAHMFASDVVQQQIRNRSSATINQITKRDFEDIKITIPRNEEEQRAIAATLSNTDEYITSLEKLIAKKRAIKQGAMQELLTGKRRLPGFSGEWVEKRIDDFGVFKSGNGFPLVYQGEHTGYPFYKVSDFSNGGNERIMSKANHYITPQVATILNCNIMPQGAIVFAKIGAAVFLERKRMVAAECCIDNNMMVFIVDKRVGHTSYFCYMMQTIKFGDFVTTTALPSLSAKSIGGINKKFPTTMDEQNAIAAVLSDMDAEIDALTAKLNKAQYIKQGMMSELLTGRIRLV